MPTREWVVLKFGGTSVSTAERWKTIASVAGERLAEGFRPLIVCSAISGATNALEALMSAALSGTHAQAFETLQNAHRALADQLHVDADRLIGADLDSLSRLLLGTSLVGEASPRVRARVLAFGEIMSTRLGAAFLSTSGHKATWADARELLVSSDEPDLSEARRILSASCSHDYDPDLRSRLDAIAAGIVVTQGFIARDPAGDTVLLGRGGSDTSAAYLAAKLGAVRCEIWTDVPGMYTANPRHVPQARLLRALDYDEAQEIASMGAKVLHPRCLAPVRKHGIPLHIRCTQRPEIAGTEISADHGGAGAQVKAISARNGITLISMDTVGMWQQVGFLADIFGCFRKHGLSVDLVSTSEANVTVSLDPVANALDPAVIKSLLADLGMFCRARSIGPCASVSLVGRNIRAILHQLGPALEVFEEQRIHLVSQAASDLNLTFVVDEEQADRLVTQLHDLLFRSRQGDAVLGPSWEELFGEARAKEAKSRPAPWWIVRRRELLELAARTSPLYVYDETTIRDAVAEIRSLRNVDRAFYAMKANPHEGILSILHDSGIGFECVSPGELDRVLSMFPSIDRGRVLFTPNFAPKHEYAGAIDAGVVVTLDNLHPLESWPDLFHGRDIFLRLDPGEGKGHHAHVRTAGTTSKFGIPPSQFDQLEELVAACGARVLGLHAHRGSGIRTAATWSETALFLATAAERFKSVSVLDVGGGLAVAERQGDDALDLPTMDSLLGEIRSAFPHFEIWLEPGRFLVAQAGVLLTRVTQIKQKDDVVYVGVDTGMNSLIRPALYGAWHEIVNLTRPNERATMTATVVGPICESGDTLGIERRIAPAREGDVMLIATAGAYGHAMSSHYNLREPAGELLV